LVSTASGACEGYVVTLGTPIVINSGAAPFFANGVVSVSED
jgi:hypothetical protein